jgi:hypothetical protein
VPIIQAKKKKKNVGFLSKLFGKKQKAAIRND